MSALAFSYYARQGIVTRYLGPTNCRGSRVKARCEAGTLTVSWDCALDVYANHRRAAALLAKRLGWHGEWHGAGLPQSMRDAYVFAMAAPDLAQGPALFGAEGGDA